MRLAGGYWVMGLGSEGIAEGRIAGARLHAHRVLRARFVDDVYCADAALGEALDLAGPARGHIADLDPVMDDRAIQLEGARDVGLAAEDLDESLRAIHHVRPP